MGAMCLGWGPETNGLTLLCVRDVPVFPRRLGTGASADRAATLNTGCSMDQLASVQVLPTSLSAKPRVPVPVARSARRKDARREPPAATTAVGELSRNVFRA